MRVDRALGRNAQRWGWVIPYGSVLGALDISLADGYRKFCTKWKTLTKLVDRSIIPQSVNTEPNIGKIYLKEGVNYVTA